MRLSFLNVEKLMTIILIIDFNPKTRNHVELNIIFML